MKITIITPHLPNLNSGAYVRNYHMMKNLSKSNDITLLSAGSEVDFQHITEFRKKVFANTYLFHLQKVSNYNSIKYYFQGKVPYIERLKNSSFNTIIKFIPKDTDIIQIEELQAYSIIEPYLNKLPGLKVLDAHNVDYLRVKSEFDCSHIIRRLVGLPVIHKLRRYEIEAIQKIDHVIVCSENDKKYFSKHIDSHKLTVIPNGVDMETFIPQPSKEQNHTVLFMGLLSYPPNNQGLKWYLNYVHREVLKNIPDYKLVVIGKNPPDWLKKIAEKNTDVRVKGFVPDVKTEITRSQICICPIFSGSGTRLKLLEYMAMGKAIVSTSKGVEGIEIIPNQYMLIEDTSRKFAYGIIHLFNNKNIRDHYGKHARYLVKSHYSWTKIVQSLENIYKKL